MRYWEKCAAVIAALWVIGGLAFLPGCDSGHGNHGYDSSEVLPDRDPPGCQNDHCDDEVDGELGGPGNSEFGHEQGAD